MSHTKRIYNRRQTYRGLWRPYHTYKQLAMKCHCSICKSRRAYLDHKKRRQARKSEEKYLLKEYLGWFDFPYDFMDCDYTYDPLAGLVNIYYDYLDPLDPWHFDE